MVDAADSKSVARKGVWVRVPLPVPIERLADRSISSRRVIGALGRLEKRIFALNDRLQELAKDERLVREELTMRRHLNDDAQRDAVVGDAEDRALAYETQKDVDRFERLLQNIDAERRKVMARRDKLLERLGTL